MVNVFDPKNWMDKNNYGNDTITNFACHFQAMLAATGTTPPKFTTKYIKVWHRSAEAKDLWQKVINHATTQMCMPSQWFNCNKEIKLRC